MTSSAPCDCDHLGSVAERHFLWNALTLFLSWLVSAVLLFPCSAVPPHQLSDPIGCLRHVSAVDAFGLCGYFDLCSRHLFSADGEHRGAKGRDSLGIGQRINGLSRDSVAALRDTLDSRRLLPPVRTRAPPGYGAGRVSIQVEASTGTRRWAARMID